MSKVIASSYSLFNFIKTNSFRYTEDLVTIIGSKEKNELLFVSNGAKFICEVQKEFEFKTTGNHLQRLREILGKVTDQPITIEFTGYKYITIKHIEV